MGILKGTFRRKFLLIYLIVSFMWVFQHSYRVSIGMSPNIRYIYSILSFIFHVLVPAIVAVIYYLIKKRKTSFLKIYSIVLLIEIVMAMIYTKSILT
ncbi:hypothetical protein [uncultured Clostridium sp.]|uniref:hypothetical protein n=1 Tax=uncultured Clostridium sp. TaxID=59620 RepID=UPI0028E94DFC|nr:hypothetical protein [uncultured Clostridium sp.]